MSDELITALDHGLNGLALGEDVGTICARYPDLSAELRPLLDVALLAQQHGTHQVAAGAELASRGQFLARAAELRASGPQRSAAGGAPRGLGWLGSRLAAHRAAAVLLALALIFVFGGYGALRASAESLPGEPLYGLKRTVEQTQLLLSPDDAARAELEQAFDERRVDEAQRVAASTRTVELEFGGLLESRAAERWRVAGITVIVGPDTPVAGTPMTGLFVQVSGRSQPDGTILAARVAVTGVILTGRVRASGAAWQIDDQVVQVGVETNIAGPPATGDRVEVNARRLQDGLLLALKITLLERGHAATPTATRTPPATQTATPAPNETETEEPEATGTPGQAAQPVEVRLVGIVEAIGVQSWQIAGQAVYVNGSTEVEGHPQVGQTVEVRALRDADGRLTARRIEARESPGGATSTPGGEGEDSGPSASSTPGGGSDDHASETPAPSRTPDGDGEDHGSSASSTPRPSDTPQSSDAASEVRFEGTLQAVGDGVWIVDGQSVLISERTEFGDRPRVGDRVEVRAFRLEDGTLVAARIEKK